jgi:glutaredoxin
MLAFILSVLLYVALFAAYIAGLVILLVGAFRQSLKWGVFCLLLPGALVVFCVMHWEKAKPGFLVCLGCVAVSIGLVFFTPGGHIPFLKAGVPKKNPGPAITRRLADKRERLAELQSQYDTLNTVVTRDYRELLAARQALNTADQAAVHKFNIDAAAYQQQNARLKQVKLDIASCQQAVSDLLDQQAKQPRVVVYTTSTCPYCKMAKDYLARKGVPYREVNIEASQENYNEYKQLGGNGVPLIIVGDRKMEGFSEQALDQML